MADPDLELRGRWWWWGGGGGGGGFDLLALPAFLPSVISSFFFSFPSQSWIHHCIHSFIKKNYSRTYLMANFVLSLICPQQSPQILDNYSIIPSDLVLSLEYPYQLQIFVILLWLIYMTYKRRHYNFISNPCTITCIYKKDTNLYIITMLSHFLL